VLSRRPVLQLTVTGLDVCKQPKKIFANGSVRSSRTTVSRTITIGGHCFKEVRARTDIEQRTPRLKHGVCGRGMALRT
jgi:hypothetical protein